MMRQKAGRPENRGSFAIVVRSGRAYGAPPEQRPAAGDDGKRTEGGEPQRDGDRPE